MHLIGRIEHKPATISAGDVEMIIRLPGDRDQGAIVLTATTEEIRLALCHVEVVIHGRGQTFTAIRPGQTAVVTDIHTTIVHVVDAPRHGCGHEQGVMIGVGIIRFAPLRIPAGYLMPGLPGIGGQMQIYTTTNDVVLIFRVHDDGVVITHLSFVTEMRAMNVRPAVSTVITAKYPQHTGLCIGSDGVQDVRIRGRDHQARAVKIVGTLQP